MDKKGKKGFDREKFYRETRGMTSEQIYEYVTGTSAISIPNPKVRIRKARNNNRVPVLYPDGEPLMPTTNKRANKWLKEKKAKVVANDLGIFQIQLLFEPSGRNKQDIVIIDDPGSSFTGICVVSKKAVLVGLMLELPGYKKGSEAKIEKNRFGKKILKYPNMIVDGMTKRRELRRGRRYRKTRRRPERWLNRSRNKIPPSILARKQLEYRVISEMMKIYPITGIGYEDVAFNHWKDEKGEKGQFFSHVEVGKNWILRRLKALTVQHKMGIGLRIIKGYETNIRRQKLGLAKSENKTERVPEAHITDCIAMGSIILDGPDIGFHSDTIEIGNKFKFDVVTRPKYERRKLYKEKFLKGGIKKRHGGTTIPGSILRKGDYVEAIMGKKAFRGWVSGYEEHRGVVKTISVSGFDWDRSGQFGVDKVRLIGRNTGLLLRSMEKEMTAKEARMNDDRDGMVQRLVEDAWGF